MALNAYLKIDGILGSSSASKHKDEIEVLSFSWGVKQPESLPGGGGGGGGAGKPTLSDFSFSKEVAKDSPVLFASVCTGKHYPDAVLTVEGINTDVKSARQSFYKVTFEDVLISSVSLAGQDNALPMEQVSLRFAKVSLEYRDARGASTKTDLCNFTSTDFLDR